MECEGCLSQVFQDHYTCSKEKCRRTYCGLCANVGHDNIDHSTWQCPACRTAERKTGDNSSTPVRHSDYSQNVTIRKKSTKLSAPESSLSPKGAPVAIPAAMPSTSTAASAPVLQTAAATCQLSSEVSELTSVIKILTQEFTSLKERLETVTISLAKCHERLDELGTAAVLTEKRLEKLEDNEKEVQSLKATVCQLQLKLSSEAQSQVRNEVEILGVPELPHENLVHIILTTANKIGADVKEQDIDWVSRFGSKQAKNVNDITPNLPRPIVFRLVRRIKRDDFIKAAKTRKNIKSSDLLGTGPDQNVYINERLTWENRQLFREARAKAKHHGFTYCWISQGTIYVRQRDGKPAMAVKSRDDIFRIFPAEQS